MAISERTGHIAVCVDKYMLVWGGYQEGDDHPGLDHYLPPEELWVYRTDTKAWQCVTVSGTQLPHHQEALPLGTSGATANFLNGYVYVFGGHNVYGNTNCLLRLELECCGWEVLMGDPEALQPSPRDKLASWVTRTRFSLVDGTTKLLIFDTVTNTWSNPKCKGVVPVARAAHAAARVDNRVFVFGGRNLEQRLGDLYELNLSTLTWSKELQPIGNRPCGRSWHTLTKISGPRLFLYGGYTQDKKPLGDAWLFDVNLVQWTKLRRSMEHPRLWHTCCVTPDEDILVFGGCSTDILSLLSDIRHCNDILEFRLSPKSLLRLCLDAAFTHRAVCNEGWEVLPQHLQAILQARLEAWEQQREPANTLQPTGDHSNKGQTCAVS
ncbi:LOW QUALITY PROTEIN: kelch domain-containing protein 2-like [Liolophura sinensis]|uniref:LOW QUALITY PROTEIN: kelch domain-containing protein 2-like n=1 Tax=Liolophura sinensis TaxID=3198878 RepID=UPI00315844E3